MNHLTPPGGPRALSHSLRGFAALALLATVSVNPSPLAAQTASAPAPVAPREGFGTIRGRVLDTNGGKYLEGAEVTLEGTGLRAYTERSGGFVLRNVPAGDYTLVVNYTGLDTKREAVTVAAGQTAEITVGLSEGEVITLSAFRVQGAKEGMAQAVSLQKISIQTKLVAAADQFGPISEGNVGEYLKYLPGLSIDYNANDARGVSLRGLNTSFTVVAVDGTPMAASSSVDTTRRFEFEQIAMNNVETTELFKTVTPDIPASATGGFVNFVTKSAFDRQDASIFSYDLSFVVPSTNVAFGRETGVWGSDAEYVIRPNLDLNYARRINEKIGFNINYRFSERYDDSPRTEITWNQATPASAAAATLWTNPRMTQYNVRSEQKLTHREAFAGKLDYHISDRTKLIVAGQWNWYDLLFNQRGPQLFLGAGSTTSGGDNPTFSSAGATNVRNDILFRNKYGTTVHFNTTLSHAFDDRSKAWLTAYWSHADGQYRDKTKGLISSTANLNPGLITDISLANATTADLPSISLMNGGTPVPLDTIRTLANYTLSPGTTFQSRPWTTNELKKGVSAHYSIDFDSFVFPTKIQVGTALDKTERDITQITYTSSAATFPPLGGAALDAYRDTGYTKDVAFGFGPFQVADSYRLASAFGNAINTYSVDNYWEFFEDNNAIYLRADVQVMRDLLLVGGVRWEEREIDGSFINRASATSRLAKTALEYSEYYPSLTFKYTPSALKPLVVRGGASRTVGHPDYADLIPSVTLETSAGAGNGNLTNISPGLKPYFTTNYDFSVDYYLRNSGVIGVALFRKDVENFIASRVMTSAEVAAAAAAAGRSPAEFANGSNTIRYNGADSSVQGIELTYAQSLSFLPKPFDGLSVQSNFTLTDHDGDDNDVLWAQQRGAAAKTFNFVLGYRVGKWSITSSTNWTDDTVFSGLVASQWVLGSANADPGRDTRMVSIKGDAVRTDLKVEYAFSSRYKVYAGIQNAFGDGRTDYLRGYLPQYSHIRLARNVYEFGEPYYNVGIRGTF